MSTVQDPTPTISVNGEGVVMVQPDMASIAIGVDITHASLGTAQAEATEQMTAVIETIKAQAIPPRDIQTSWFNITTIYDNDRDWEIDSVRGFRVTNQVHVAVRDLTRLSALLDAVVANGANRLYGIAFQVSDHTEALRQARKLAMQDARNAAEIFANAGGASVGSVMAINEGYSSHAGANRSHYSLAEESLLVPIEVGESEISCRVSVTYALIAAESDADPA